MSRRMDWREGEEGLISITPVAVGLFKPVLSLVTAVVLIQLGANHVHFIHQHQWLFLLVLAGPCVVVLLTRTWRWRSYKVRVTNERVIIEGGAARHFRTSIELRDVITSRVEQGFYERLVRRGSVSLETSAGTMNIGCVRHPAALCRLIDLERASYRRDDVPFDTVFEYGHPDPHDFVVNPSTRRARHRRD